MQNYVNEALSYWNQGLNVVPVQGKKPLVQWNKWQTERQTKEEFDGLPWGNADGFALICGVQAANGMYVVTIDYDNPDFDLKLVPITQTESTPHGGFHFVYFSRQNARGHKEHDLKLELLGMGNLCIMHPSQGYQKLNDNFPTEIESIEQVFNDLVFKLGGKPKGEVSVKVANSKKRFKKFNGEIRPCMKAALEQNQIEHLMRLAIAAEYKGAGLDDASIANLFKGQVDFNLEKTLYQVKTADPSKVAKCETVKEMGYCLGPEKCKFYNEAFNVEYKPFVELSDGRLCEEGYDGKEIFFLVYDPKTEKIERTSQVVDGETTFMPVENEEVKMGIVLLPSDIAEYVDDKALFEEIMSYMDSWHEQQNRKERKLDVLYSMMTYLADLMPKTSYRRALGPFGRGKSAWEDVVGSVCYRPIFLSGCDTDKSFCRRMDRWRGTAVIDEGDYDNSSLYAFIIKVLNVGYDRRRGYYTRCDDIDPQKTINYYVYGPKVISSRARYRDTALESRCLTFIAKQNMKPMPLHRMEKFDGESRALRNKLVLWRFRNYSKMKAQAKILETTKIEEELGLQHISSRIKEIIAPIFLISSVLAKEELTSLAFELDEQLKTDPDYQLELQFNHALIEIMDELERDGDTLHSGDTPIGKAPLEVFMSPSESKAKVEGSPLRIPLIKIAKKILDNEEPEINELKGLCGRLSHIFTNRFGFQMVSGHGRKRYVIVPGAYYSSVTTMQSVTMPEQKAITIEGMGVHIVGPYTAFLYRLEMAHLFWMLKNTKEHLRNWNRAWLESANVFIGAKNADALKKLCKDERFIEFFTKKTEE